MKLKTPAVVVGWLSMVASAVLGQTVLLNDPVSWITMRNGQMVVKAQLDTAQIRSKKVFLELAMVSGGREKILQKKTFSISDYSEEFDLGKIGSKLVGGYDYCKINWSIPGGTEKGVCVPVGVAVLEELPVVKVVSADSAGQADETHGKSKVDVGNCRFSVSWDRKQLAFWILKGESTTGFLEIAIDGKNAKNAFLSYPDRIIRYFPGSDSVVAVHYKRNLSGDKIEYTEQVWNSELLSKSVDGGVVVCVPWYDLGVIPFVDRTMGIAVFELAGSATTSAFPATAAKENPATWANLVLVR